MDARVTKPGEAKSQSPELLRPSREEAEAAVRTLIAWAGDDPEREGLVATPERVVRHYEEAFSGYREDGQEALGRTFADVGGYNDIVIVRDIDFHSYCEHHMLPIIGTAHIGYYPSDRVVGLSKLARVIDVFAGRLQTQERLTADIIGAVDATIQPRGVAVLIEAEHQCMTLRGVRAHGASTVTTQFTGAFRDDPAEQIRFMTLVKGGHQTG